ncbi:MAG: DUF58 domain-containing protein [Candidatus Korarchaeota archaeon]|nr:DUF58 domain-containing protein [Candidatus Korarchaeota archaeon]
MSEEPPLSLGPSAGPLLLAPIVLTGLAIATFRWRLLAAAAPPLILLVVALVLSTPREVRAERRIDRDVVAEGERVDVRVELEFEGGVAAAVEDDLPPQGEVESGTWAALVGGAGRVELDYSLRTMRGFWKFRWVRVGFRDPLGIFERWRSIECRGYLSVMPSLVRAGGLRTEAKGVKPLLGRSPSDAPGMGTEFYALREYVPGDPMRSINWKATARLGQLISNDYEAEKAADLVIIVDSTLPTGVGDGKGDTLLDVEARVAIALADEALRSGLRVGLASVGGPGVWVGPDWGNRQLLKLGRTLAVLYPSGGAETAPLVAESIAVHIGPRTHVAVITPLTGEHWIDAVAKLASAGRRVTVISPSPNVFSLPESPDLANSLAFQILETKRSLLLAKLKPYAEVVDWNPKSDLGVIWRRVRLGA